MTNEKDKAQALNIAEAFFENRLPIINGKPFASAHSNPTLNLADKIEAALTAIRNEEREAAFKEAAAILNDFGRELRKVDFLMRLEAAIRTHKQVQLDRVLTEAEIEDPVGVRLTELELQRMDRVEAAASTKGENDG